MTCREVGEIVGRPSTPRSLIASPSVRRPCGTILLKQLKPSVLIRVNVRRVSVAMAFPGILPGRCVRVGGRS